MVRNIWPMAMPSGRTENYGSEPGGTSPADFKTVEILADNN